MINFERYILDNGLRVLIHQDKSTPMVAVNVLYNVGARDESPERTGLAHLFEHLMFSGSAQVSNFDDTIQRAGGDCNAFTNNDLTNFYDVLPAQNLEVALWMEADRMKALQVNPKSLEVQRSVVLEEFKETCLNQPYGDIWHKLADLSFKVHPYKWPTIGKMPEHIEQATLEQVNAFFATYYRPNNAIIVLSGNFKVEEALSLIRKWFEDIPPGPEFKKAIPQEPHQLESRRKDYEMDVPLDALFISFHSPGRQGESYYISDLITDLMANGSSSRLYRRLLKEQRLFTQIDAYITGNIDPGLLIIEGKPAAGVSLETAEKAIWRELDLLKGQLVPEREMDKLKHKAETTLSFSESNVLNKAINLAFYELIGNANLINEEIEYYRNIDRLQLQGFANEIFREENSSTIYYHARN